MTTEQTTKRVPRAGRREWLVLAVLALPTLLVSLDLFVMLLAVPHLSAALHASSTPQSQPDRPDQASQADPEQPPGQASQANSNQR